MEVLEILNLKKNNPMEKNKLIYTSHEWDKIEIDVKDKNIHEALQIVIRLLLYMGYREDSIKEGLDEVAF